MQIEGRMADLAAGFTALDQQMVSREEVAKALADFDPVWDALRRRRASWRC